MFHLKIQDSDSFAWSYLCDTKWPQEAAVVSHDVET